MNSDTSKTPGQAEIVTYTCVFKKGENRPWALFLKETDAEEWHVNPALFTNARRRVVLRKCPLEIESEAVEILRALLEGDDSGIFASLDDARDLLSRLRPISHTAS